MSDLPSDMEDLPAYKKAMSIIKPVDAFVS